MVRKVSGAEKAHQNKNKRPRNVDCEQCGVTMRDKFVLKRHVSFIGFLIVSFDMLFCALLQF